MLSFGGQASNSQIPITNRGGSQLEDLEDAVGFIILRTLRTKQLTENFSTFLCHQTEILQGISAVGRTSVRFVLCGMKVTLTGTYKTVWKAALTLPPS